MPDHIQLEIHENFKTVLNKETGEIVEVPGNISLK